MKKTISLLGSAGLPDDALPDEDPSYWHEVESKLRARSHDIARLSERTSWRFRFSGSFAQAAAILLVAGAVIFFSVYSGDNSGTVNIFSDAGPGTHRGPVFFVRPDSPDGQTEAPTRQPGDSYSDSNYIFSPAEIRRFRNYIRSVSADKDETIERF